MCSPGSRLQRVRVLQRVQIARAFPFAMPKTTRWWPKPKHNARPQSRHGCAEARQAEQIRVSANNAVPGQQGKRQEFTTKLLGCFCDMQHSAALSAQIKQELADDSTTESESDGQSEDPWCQQQTAVAANNNQGVTLNGWAPSGMAAMECEHSYSVRKGVPKAPAAGSNPAAGPAFLPHKTSDGKCVNVGNGLISHAVATLDVEANAVLQWTATTGNHLIALSLLPEDRRCSKYNDELKRCFEVTARSRQNATGPPAWTKRSTLVTARRVAQPAARGSQLRDVSTSPENASERKERIMRMQRLGLAGI